MTDVSGRRQASPVEGTHEHVDRVSTKTTIFVLVAIAAFLYSVRLILLPFVIAGLLAYLCNPALEWLTARARLPRLFSAIVAFLALTSIAGLIGWSSASSLLPEIADVARDFPATVDGLVRDLIGQRTINLFGPALNADQVAHAVITDSLAWIKQAGGVVVLGGLAAGSFFGFLLTCVLLFYFLLNGPQFVRGLLRLVPPRHRPLIRQIWQRLDPVLKRYLIGIVVVVIYATAAAYVGLGLVLGLPHATFLALLTGIFEMIPMIGPAAAIVTAGLIAVHHATGFAPILAYAAYATALRLSIDQLFGPLVLGTAARMHPTVIIFCFLSGAILFGIVGVILAVPVALTTRITLETLYDEPMEKPLGG